MSDVGWKRPNLFSQDANLAGGMASCLGIFNILIHVAANFAVIFPISIDVNSRQSQEWVNTSRKGYRPCSHDRVAKAPPDCELLHKENSHVSHNRVKERMTTSSIQPPLIIRWMGLEPTIVKTATYRWIQPQIWHLGRLGDSSLTLASFLSKFLLGQGGRNPCPRKGPRNDGQWDTSKSRSWVLGLHTSDRSTGAYRAE